jgi:site-specific recombinase
MTDATGKKLAPIPKHFAPTPLAIPGRMLALLEGFCRADTPEHRRNAFAQIARWTREQSDLSGPGLLLLAEALNAHPELRARVQDAFAAMLSEVQSLSLLAEAGLPSVHTFSSEIVRHLVARLLPSAMADTDSRRLLNDLFRRKEDARRFAAIPPELFTRVITALFGDDAGVWQRQLRDLHEAMRLLASRISGLGLAPEVRERAGIDSDNVGRSPFYELLRCTEELIRCSESLECAPALEAWKHVVARCRGEMEVVYEHMQSAGISVELVFDLKTIQACLVRMENIARVLAAHDDAERLTAIHHLLNRVIEGHLEDSRITWLLHENLNLLARKIVDRTGETGEHYIAADRSEYRQMWLAAIGGGLLTVFTAAMKMRIVEANMPPFVEGLAAGTNYAVSFIFLQIFGLALATKQPATTAATFARIIRDSRGQQRSSRLTDFVARITTTQLAAAIGNVAAVSLGAVLFEWLWWTFFHESYLPRMSATHVLETLHPYASGTAFFAIITGILLWLAALIGSWIENAAVYYRSVEALAQHPVIARLGEARAHKLTRYLKHNMGGWFTSIALGYLLGFTPELGKFFGIPLDVRHVTLSTGTLALAAARFGTSQWGQMWVYHAIAGIVVIFVLNLGVSFMIAAYVALRAYHVGPREQWSILGYLVREALRSPLRFLVPRYGNGGEAHSSERISH